MTAAHDAALTVARDSFQMLRTALEGLPDDALAWAPAQGANSLAVLTMHTMTAARFFFEATVGEVGSIARYRAGERSDAFHTAGGSARELQGKIDAFNTELAGILGRGREEHLTAVVNFPEEPSMTATGMGYLFRTIGHIREHVGQAQLTRDLWLAQQA